MTGLPRGRGVLFKIAIARPEIPNNRRLASIDLDVLYGNYLTRAGLQPLQGHGGTGEGVHQFTGSRRHPALFNAVPLLLAFPKEPHRVLMGGSHLVANHLLDCALGFAAFCRLNRQLEHASLVCQLSPLD